MRKTIYVFIFILFFFSVLNVEAQKIPEVYSRIKYNSDNKLEILIDGKMFPVKSEATYMTLENIRGNPQGTATGLFFDFKNPKLFGTLYFGFYANNRVKHPQPVFYHTPIQILGGMGAIVIKNQLEGKYDITEWRKTGKGVLGYRLADNKGNILYDGKVNFKFVNDKYEVDYTIVEGPFVNLLTDSSAVISFETNMDDKCSVTVNGKVFTDEKKTTHHQIAISGLLPATAYDYVVKYGENENKYDFKTAPQAGSRTSFVFGYASDSRAGAGGGERNIYGTNAYIVKRIMTMAYAEKVAFMQYTGDMISGYVENGEEADLQYSNWKRTIENFAHYFPVYTTMGNHEVVMYVFRDTLNNRKFSVNRFPFDTESSEAVFMRNFINPTNGPESEDGSKYDPRPKKDDFPSYKESVYSYTYDNMAMIVLNSNYLYAPSLKYEPVEGNLHGYIMDNQLKWVEETVAKYESDTNIDHIFITVHTPFFPNGGHVADDMFYGGNNEYRPVINGQKVEKGIIERRDQLLDIIVNKSKKTLAILTGDEHNYCRLHVTPQTSIYPENYALNKISLQRTIYQINNGSAGAPYYGQEQAPWSESVMSFSTQYALVFFEINGKQVKIKVVNPDTNELIDTFVLTK